MKIKKKLKLEQVENDLCLPFLFDISLNLLIIIDNKHKYSYLNNYNYNNNRNENDSENNNNNNYNYNNNYNNNTKNNSNNNSNDNNENNDKNDDNDSDNSIILIGIDTEKEPINNSKISLIQLSVRFKNNKEVVYIFDLLKLQEEDELLLECNNVLKLIFENKNIIKVGHGLKQDFNELIDSYPTLTCFHNVESVIETNSLHQKLNPQITRLVSLKYLTRQYLHSNLLKSHQCSSWGTRPLTSEQINYAACDALVLLRLYDSMCYEIEDLFGEINLQEMMLTIQHKNYSQSNLQLESDYSDNEIKFDSTSLCSLPSSFSSSPSPSPSLSICSSSSSSSSTITTTSSSIVEFNKQFYPNIQQLKKIKNFNKKRRISETSSHELNSNNIHSDSKKSKLAK